MKIREIRRLPAKTKKDKARILRQYHLGKEIQKIAARLSYTIWWQDLRKKDILILNHCLDAVLQELSRRKNLKFLDLYYYSFDELALLATRQKRVLPSVIKQRKKQCAFHIRQGKLYFETGKKADDLNKKLSGKRTHTKITALDGSVVSKGRIKVRGKVCILLSPRQIYKMKQGNVLVTTMTSPDFIFAMKKASAIVTDTGGMTSHAAIISRELGIPCIVGTKIATKVLKDGQLVEVNANHGTVKVVKG